jgi:protein-S-isoprenylcysteine O-methyltransferase Ste14
VSGRDEASAAPDRSGAWLFLKDLLFTVLVPGTVAVYVPVYKAGGIPALRELEWGGPQWLAIFPLAAGTGIYLRCVWDFATVGRGTPAPIDAPRRLVVAGLYRYVRNPMYVGILLLVTGWAILFGSLWIGIYAAFFVLSVHLFVVFYEEPHLRRTFGEPYERYCRGVRRWIPGRPPKVDV